jgi:hypothetical protein
MIRKLTPVLVVEAIEPLLPLWTALGFTKTVEVPQGDRLGFVILQSGNAEVMLQTVESVREDEPRLLAARPFGPAAVYIEVDDIEAAAARIPDGTEVIAARRTTFYGATEVILRDAAGNVVTLAQMK